MSMENERQSTQFLQGIPFITGISSIVVFVLRFSILISSGLRFFSGRGFRRGSLGMITVMGLLSFHFRVLGLWLCFHLKESATQLANDLIESAGNHGNTQGLARFFWLSYGIENVVSCVLFASMVGSSCSGVTGIGEHIETLFGLYPNDASCYSRSSELPLRVGGETQQTGGRVSVGNSPALSCRSSKISTMKPILICRTDRERCLIEPSINSLRVSIKIKQADEMERVLCRNFSRFLMQRAESFTILRRKPLEVSSPSLVLF